MWANPLIRFLSAKRQRNAGRGSLWADHYLYLQHASHIFVWGSKYPAGMIALYFIRDSQRILCSACYWHPGGRGEPEVCSSKHQIFGPGRAKDKQNIPFGSICGSKFITIRLWSEHVFMSISRVSGYHWIIDAIKKVWFSHGRFAV